MKAVYNTSARKRAVNLTLNEDLEVPSADFLAREKQKRTDAIEAAKQTCAMWNRVYAKHGSPADEYMNL